METMTEWLCPSLLVEALLVLLVKPKHNLRLLKPLMLLIPLFASSNDSETMAKKFFSDSWILGKALGQ